MAERALQECHKGRPGCKYVLFCIAEKALWACDRKTARVFTDISEARKRFSGHSHLCFAILFCQGILPSAPPYTPYPRRCIRQGTARPCPAANTASHTDQAGNAALRDRAKPHAPATPGVSSRQSTHTKRRQAPAKVFLADISKKISHFIAKHFGAPFFCYIFAPNKYKQTEMNKSYASFFYFYFYFASNCEAGSRV